jgi:DNA-directed RNA polymerase subunit L
MAGRAVDGMQVKIVEEKKGRLVFDVKGDSHTVTGALKKELWNDEHVRAAGYGIEHPLINVPRFVVETDGEEPRKAVSAAVKRLQKQVAKLRDDAKDLK